MPTTLQTLLNLKLWQEDNAKSHLASAIKELSDAEHQLSMLNQRFEDLGTTLDAKSHSNIAADDYQRYSEELQYLFKEIEDKKQLVATKNSAVITARELLNEAVIQRKIFDRLVQKAKEQKQKNILKNEQNLTDEASTINFTIGE